MKKVTGRPLKMKSPGDLCQVCLSVPYDVRAALQERAKQEGRSLSNLVTMLVRRQLDQDAREKPRVRVPAVCRPLLLND